VSRLAVIATLYGHRAIEHTPRMIEALAAQTRPPDELWWMVEDVPQTAPFHTLRNTEVLWNEVPTPRQENGQYAVIPYSLKANIALDATSADYITYLTDDSWPEPAKYERMVAALDEHPEWGAVYCSQDYGSGVRFAGDVMRDAYCNVDHTQVMHRRTADRWPLEVADIMLGDAIFWRRLHASLGSFYPIPETLDQVRQTPDGISGGNRG
jgi:hypothetical protein